MKTISNLVLVMALTLFIVHEIDAMTHHEWRLLPMLGGLNDDVARQVFVLLHIPIFFGLIWSLFLTSWRQWAARIFCVLLVIHGCAHFMLSGHEFYSFIPPIETITVYGAALSGIIYLVVGLKKERK